jgi:hypothetical protein
MPAHSPARDTSSRRAGRSVLTVLFGLVAVGWLARSARAHEVSGTRFDAPLPLGPLLVGAGLTVALTAAWLAAADTTPVPSAASRQFHAVSDGRWRGLRRAVAVLFTIAVGGVVVVGLFGPRGPNENFATVFTWGL